jgi:crossover junction endodeoxyribonuclease RuvC
VEGNRSKQSLIECGCIETASNAAAPDRLAMIYDEIVKLVEEYGPDESAVEELYFFKNQKTVMQVGQARGVIVVALTKAGLPVYDYTPLQVKQSVSGYGRADKRQVQQMVKAILNLERVPKPDDAADAVAVALTHLMFNKDLT